MPTARVSVVTDF